MASSRVCVCVRDLAGCYDTGATAVAAAVVVDSTDPVFWPSLDQWTREFYFHLVDNLDCLLPRSISHRCSCWTAVAER